MRMLQLATVASLVLGLAACGGSEGPPSQGTPAVSTPASGASTGAVAGIAWTVPPGWTEEGAHPMRAATYDLPQGGSCAVYYFGASQGGSVEANIERWAGQFEGSPKPTTTTRTIASLPVTTVQIDGTYTSPGGPMMQSQGSEEDYRLLGAIVEGPQGSVFFKCTGPRAAMEAAQTSFDALLDSLHHQ